MISHPKLRFAPLWWAFGWALVLAVLFGSLEPPDNLPSLGVRDKVLHYAAYGAMTFWFAGITERRRWPLVALGMFVLGMAVEVAQGAMGMGRSADWRDLIANTLGIITAIGVAYAGLGSWMLQVERRLGLS